MAERKTGKTYVDETNVLVMSFVGYRFYFCPRVRYTEEGKVRRVMGKKYDVTDDLQPFLKARYRSKS